MSQWKNYWQKYQKYQTLCLKCISQNSIKQNENKKDKNEIVDEYDKYPSWGAIHLSSASHAMLKNWYDSAQGRIYGSGGRQRNKSFPFEVSDDDEDDIIPQWTFKTISEPNPSLQKIATLWLRLARANLQRKRGWE